MRTTVRIDDDLLRSLKAKAQQENTSLTNLLNRVIRNGLKEPRNARPRRQYREKVFDMGRPQFDVNKALALAAAIEDDETLRKLDLGK